MIIKNCQDIIKPLTIVQYSKRDEILNENVLKYTIQNHVKKISKTVAVELAKFP